MATDTSFVEVRATPLHSNDPAQIGPFRLRGRLSHRPYATTYLGVDALRRMAVITTFRQGGRVEIPRQVLDDSLAAVHRVNGTTVATVLDTGWQDDTPWIALRYIPGTTAAEHFAGFSRLDEPQLLPFAAALASGLRILNRAGVVHGDMGPHNVTLTPRGPVITGFGGPPGPKGHRIGPWVAPEWSRQAPAHAGDLYAWGWLVAAAGLGPESLKFKEVRRGSRHLSTDLSTLPGPLPKLVAAALESHPSDRPSASALADALPLRQWPPRRVPPVLLAPKGYRPPGYKPPKPVVAPDKPEMKSIGPGRTAPTKPSSPQSKAQKAKAKKAQAKKLKAAKVTRSKSAATTKSRRRFRTRPGFIVGATILVSVVAAIASRR